MKKVFLILLCLGLTTCQKHKDEGSDQPTPTQPDPAPQPPAKSPDETFEFGLSDEVFFNNTEVFGVLGGKLEGPKRPVIFMIVTGLETLPKQTSYTEFARIMQLKTGSIAVILEVPCHGYNRAQTENYEQQCWHDRLLNGTPVVTPFNAYAKKVYDYVNSKGVMDESKTAVVGFGRGAFFGTQWALDDSRIKNVLMLTPLIDVRVLEMLQNIEGEMPAGQAVPENELKLSTTNPSYKNKTIYLSVGNRDQRVGTDRVLTYAQEILTNYTLHSTQADAASRSLVELFQIPDRPNGGLLTGFTPDAATRAINWLEMLWNTP